MYVETISCHCFFSRAVFNLTNNVDLDNTKKKMEIYQKENKDVIQKNKLKLVGAKYFLLLLY